MANAYVKATQVVNTALGLLSRELVLPNLIWKNPVGNFKGALNDTISIRLPAYMAARTRTMRSGAAITMDDLTETKVDVTLNTQVYKAVAVTDEEMTLDIVDFGTQILEPSMAAVARGIEDALVTTMAGTTYRTNINMTLTDPYQGIVDARIALNKYNVPMSGRFLAIGANVEAAILKSDRLSKFDQSGDSNALRDASIGRIAGFTAVSCPALDPDTAIAGHSTAFVLSTVTPVIPDGCTWGEQSSYDGFSLRVLKDYDFINVRDRMVTDTFMGTAATLDRGTFDSKGRFVPSVAGAESPVMIRAVKLTQLAS